MKNKRNCSYPYGMTYPNMMPGMPMMTPPTMVQPYDNQIPNNTNYDNNLVNRINNLEKRVSALESMYTNNYNSSNYQML